MGSIKNMIFVAFLCALLGSQLAANGEKPGSKEVSNPLKKSSSAANKAPAKPAADQLNVSDTLNVKSYDGWRLKQVCIYQGDEQVTWCSYGVKIENPHNGLTAIYTAPFKVVTYYDLRTGLVAVIPIEKNDNPYQKTVAVTNGLLLNDVPVHKVGASVVCNLPATKYETAPDYMLRQIKAFQSHSVSPNDAAAATYDVIDTIKGDPLALKFVASFYGIPYKSGLPGFFKYTKVSGRTIPHLETKSCTQAKISANEFSVPPNLKTATSSQAVLSGADAYMLGL